MLCIVSSSEEFRQTDPGGPLVVQGTDSAYMLAGILSRGMGCNNRDDVGVFTNIAAVRDWIAE